MTLIAWPVTFTRVVEDRLEMTRLIHVRRPGLLLLWGVWLFALVMGLGLPPVERTQEARVLETAREMLESGGEQWLIPRLNGEVRVEKPPLAYWLSAGAFAVLGVNEFAGRLPFALLAWLQLPIVWSLGKKWLGPRAGLLAAGVLGSSYLFMRYGRLAETDILASVFLTLAIWAFAHAGDSRRWGRFALFHVAGLAIGLAGLSKGPPAVFALLFLGCWCAVERNWKLLRGFILSGAMLTAAVVGGWWFLYIRSTPQWPVIAFELARVTARGQHPGWFFNYIPQLLAGIAPWSALAIVGVIQMSDRSGLVRWVRRAAQSLVRRFRKPSEAPASEAVPGEMDLPPHIHGDEGGARAVLIWSAVVLLPLFFIRNKQFHYLVPVMPAVAMWCGYAIDRAMKSPAAGIDRLTGARLFWMTLIGLLAAGAGVIWIARHERGFVHVTDIAMSVLVLSTTIGVIAFTRVHGLGRGALALALCAAIGWSTGIGRWDPSLTIMDHRAAARRIRGELGDGSFVFYGENVSFPLIYHLRAIAPRVKTPEELSARPEAPGRLAVIGQTKNNRPPPALPVQWLEVMKIEMDDNMALRVYMAEPPEQ